MSADDSRRLPVILAVDDDRHVLSALRRDLRRHYQGQYQVMAVDNPQEALELLEELAGRLQPVALIVSDQRMPGMLGVDLLAKARAHYPEARRVLLTAYSDIEAAVRAINQVQVHYYLTKPWEPPDERLFPILDDQLSDWALGPGRLLGSAVAHLLGWRYSPEAHELKTYLTGNLIPYRWVEADLPEGKELMERLAIPPDRLPVFIDEQGERLERPTPDALANHLHRHPGELLDVYDLAIVGAGPAGLAAAVYGGSEGLSTLLIDKQGPGGQAGASSRIENYLGFPTGVSGAELTNRAWLQAQRFGVSLLAPRNVQEITLEGAVKRIDLSDDQPPVRARAVLLTTGVDYRELDVPGAKDYYGAGVWYGSATAEAGTVRDKPVAVVGGGNSAGQGAMYLSRFASRVYLIVRRPDLTETMSRYLIDQIKATENIEVVPETAIAAIEGDGRQLQALCLCSPEHIVPGQTPPETFLRRLEVGGLFVYIGARPLTDWIQLNILKDDKGFIRTGRQVLQDEQAARGWGLDREPYSLETCVPGIFAAGDVRAGAMARVASAVGEGAMAVSYVHRYLAET